ncbi:MAG: leucine-rich repeat protein, partial [Clostridia bacterium]|nr:leucine-rich repeat protein [Clostridia bacterium]
MKKIFLLLMGVLVALTLIACEQPPVDPTPTPPDPTPHVHNFGDWSFISEPTCVQFGEKTRTCEECGESETETVPLGDHSFEGGECEFCGTAEYSQGLEYTLTSDKKGYVLTGVGECDDEEIVVPNHYNGLPVVSVGDGAFAENKQIVKITISINITIIGDGAFSGCSKLEDVKMPEHLDEVGDNAFKDCTALPSVNIPESVTGIGSSAFSGCSKLESVKVPDSVILLGDSAFKNCTSLIEIQISINIKKVSSGLLSGCTSLESVEIPSGVTKIESEAFAGCTSLKNPVIPTTVEKLEDKVFFGCSSLTDISLPDTIVNIGNMAFAGCTSLESVKLPAGLLELKNELFADCPLLETLTIPYAVEKILEDFLKNSSITHIDLEASSHPEGLDKIVIEIEITIEIGVTAGHAYEAWYVTKEPTCTSEGERAHKCAECGFVEKAIIPRLSHTPDREADCTNDSLCSSCGTMLEEHHHSFVFHDFLAPTCKDEGHNAYQYCTACDYTTKQIIPATDVHRFNLTAANCDTDKYCLDCGTVVGEATGHNIVYVPKLEPKCNEAGHEAYEYCSNSGCTYTTYQSIPATGIHNPSAESATCMRDVHCLTCGTVISAKLDHNYVNSTCSMCGIHKASENLLYTLNNSTKTATIVGYTGNPTAVIIPEKIGEYTVTSISESAFPNGSAQSIRTLVIPNTVTYLSPGLLQYCAQLQDLTIPFVGSQTTRPTGKEYSFGFLFSTSYKNG